VPARTTARIEKAYLDSAGAIHAKLADGSDIQISKQGRYRRPHLAANGTVGALRLKRLRLDPSRKETIEVAEELILFRSGTIARRIAALGFIRDWCFYNEGDQVVIYSGGLHFAGSYLLIDATSGKELARSTDPVTDASPPWVVALADRVVVK
jgi:hypothetical protein